MDNRPIGVFDSGLGGLTTVRRVREILPHENIIYLGDTGRVPYGTRSNSTILKYTRQDVAFLRSFDIKAIIVACNTVSSVALDTVAAETDVPMIGVIEPACEKALRATKNSRVGVIGTPATIRSGAYERRLKAENPALTVLTQACPLFVPLVENGRVRRGDVVIETVVREYLAELKRAQIDTLILGCTHYPLLDEVIADFCGQGVTLIDSGAAAADRARNVLTPASADQTGDTRYFVTDDPSSFRSLASAFLQTEVGEDPALVELAGY